MGSLDPALNSATVGLPTSTSSADPEVVAPASSPAATEGIDGLGLGRLHVVTDLRSVWMSESAKLTPWLFENLELLSDALGIRLTPVAMEHPVGPFRLDILANDHLDRNVAIENQVEAADHSHLGQLLLYSAHVNAATSVWITPRFRDEQRQALIWLNENTLDGIRFFGVELGIVRIGTSPPAPVFNVVVRPNDLQKADTGSPPGEVSDANIARRQFLDQVMDGVAQTMPGFRRPGGTYRSYVTFRSGPFGIFSITFTRDQRLRVEVYLDCGNRHRNKILFDELYAARGRWESALGFTLAWERIDEARASRIASYLDFWLPGGEADAEMATQWATARTLKMLDVFEKYLRTRATELRSTTPHPDPDDSNLPATSVPAEL
jgi:hypothetical protein